MKITLKSGRSFNAHETFIGISAELHMSDGYDNAWYFDDEGVLIEWTKEEKQEIAAMMIDRWSRWRDTSS